MIYIVGQSSTTVFTPIIALVEIKLSPASTDLRCIYSSAVTAYVLDVIKSWSGKKDLLLKE
jgi:hypothetical protein